MDDVLAFRHVSLSNIRDIAGFRKISYLTFLLNQKIASFSPVSFRAVNMFIHIVNAFLVYLLTNLTVSRFLIGEEPDAGRGRNATNDSYSPGDTAFFASLFAGLIFALHPLNINAVSYIIQRMASLAAMFVLLALISYREAYVMPKGLKSSCLYGLSGVLLVAGVFAKENAVLGLPLILLYDYIFLSRFNRAVFFRRASAVLGISLAGIGSAVYVLNFQNRIDYLVNAFLHPDSPLSGQAWMAADVSWTPAQHVLTEFRVVSRYIILFFLPLPRLLVFDWWGFPISKSLTEPITTLLAFGLILLLMIFAFRKMRHFPFLCFGILWYIVAISLESFFALGLDLYFEHRNYLPLAGLIAGISGQAAVSLRGRVNSRAVWLSACALCAVLAVLTFSRNFVWKDSVTLWEDTYKKCPSNERAMMALGNAYLKNSDMEKAERYYRDVIDASIGTAKSRFLDDAVYSLGMLYLFRHDLEKARNLIAKLRDDGSPRLKILKSFYNALDGRVDTAIEEYKRLAPQVSGNDKVTVYTLLGDAWRSKAGWAQAIDAYQKAISLDPAFTAAYYGMGDSYLGMGDLPMAEDSLRKALSMEPDHDLALADMADLVLIRHENPENALPIAEKALSKQSPFYQPYLAMANVLIALGREGEADGYYRQAVKRGMAEYMVPFSKARISYLKGDKKKFLFYLRETDRYDLPGELRRIVKENLKKEGAG